jgi:uncharacterized membrane-anchored protein
MFPIAGNPFLLILKYTTIMEEMEIPTEHLQEAIHEKAEEEKEKWVMWVALSTAFMAVLAAIAGLMGGHHVNEALIDQIKASDQWAYYQAKGIKREISASTDKILEAIPGSKVVPTAELKEAVARYEKEKEEIKATAEEHQKASEEHLEKHVTLAKAVTIFQIAIAISAIAILTRKKPLWYGSIALTLAGAVFLLLGILH